MKKTMKKIRNTGLLFALMLTFAMAPSINATDEIQTACMNGQAQA